MLPQQIDRYWDFIKQAFDASLPDPSVANKQKLLESILVDRLQVWVICRGLDAVKIRGIVVTVLIEDSASGIKDCLVYAAHTFRPVSDSGWKAIDRALCAFAEANHCDRITTITKEPRVLELMEEYGYDTSYHFVQKELR